MNQNPPQTAQATPKKPIKEKIQIGLKFIFVIGACIFMVFNTLYGLANPSVEIRCVWDFFFEMTNSLNALLTNQTLLKKYILILTSFMIDGMILSTLIHWCFYGKSFRFFFSFINLYVFHILVRLIFFVEIPDNALWEYPGFPSIFVSYIKTTSMFFSNPIGLLMICMLEWRILGKIVLMALTASLIIIESFIMIIFRGYYCIDIFSAIVFGHYFFILVKKYVKGFDRKIEEMRKDRTVTPLAEDKVSTDVDEK